MIALWGRIRAWLAIAGAVVLAIVTALLVGRKQGDQGRQDKQEDADHDRAEGIRSRIERDLDDELRKHDNAGWRD